MFSLEMLRVDLITFLLDLAKEGYDDLGGASDRTLGIKCHM